MGLAIISGTSKGCAGEVGQLFVEASAEAFEGFDQVLPVVPGVQIIKIVAGTSKTQGDLCPCGGEVADEGGFIIGQPKFNGDGAEFGT